MDMRNAYDACTEYSLEAIIIINEYHWNIFIWYFWIQNDATKNKDTSL